MAAGVLSSELAIRGLHRRVAVAAAGTRVNQTGHPPDPRAVKVCADMGIDISRSRARQMRQKDFLRYDFILPMDRKNYDWLEKHAPDDHPATMALFGGWLSSLETVEEIPDPYFGSLQSFGNIFDQIQQAASAFADHLGAQMAHLATR